MQGYLANTVFSSIRIRVSDERAWLNIKRATPGVKRAEYEYLIPVDDAHELLGDLCERHLIEKTRYSVHCAGSLWQVDVFAGDNARLNVAEIELDSPEQPFDRPSWLDEEVTHDLRYYKNMLSTQPYKDWI